MPERQQVLTLHQKLGGLLNSFYICLRDMNRYVMKKYQETINP